MRRTSESVHRPKTRFAFLGMFVFLAFFTGTTAAEEMGRYGVKTMLIIGGLLCGIVLLITLYLFIAEIKLTDIGIESLSFDGRKRLAFDEIDDVRISTTPPAFGVPKERVRITGKNGKIIAFDSWLSGYETVKSKFLASWKAPEPPPGGGEGG